MPILRMPRPNLGVIWEVRDPLNSSSGESTWLRSSTWGRKGHPSPCTDALASGFTTLTPSSSRLQWGVGKGMLPYQTSLFLPP